MKFERTLTKTEQVIGRSGFRPEGMAMQIGDAVMLPKGSCYLARSRPRRGILREVAVAAEDHFGSDQVGGHDVIMALQRLVKRGRIMRLQTSTDSRFLAADGKPAETLAMVCNACELYFVYMDETEVLWTDLGATKRY